jgi:hypothetical protein
MNISRAFIGLGLLCLVIGMGFGMWMGANQNFQFADAHAHWNLLGFVTSTLYGLIHRSHPQLARSRLAWPQFGLHAVGVLCAGPGVMLAVAAHNDTLAMIGGVLVLLAALTFLAMFVTAKTEPA